MNFNELLDTTKEYGTIVELIYPICICSGLPGARVSEMVVFEEGGEGKVLAMNKDYVEILIFSDLHLTVGSRVARTNEFLHMKVGFELLGNVIDPLGNLLFPNPKFKSPQLKIDIDVHPEPISFRSRIKKQLVTGITLIDQLIPLGMGQRELIVGDRKTGKTGTVFSIIKNQANSGNLVIYAAIGKRSIEIKKIRQDFENAGIMDKVCIVASSSSSSPSLIDLTPYAAMGIADFLKNNKKDVLIVFDDLSTHAKFYREISLMAKKFPGRDSYPGDMFYKHAKLLERAGNYIVEKSDVSITALAIAETVEGELTDHITSNLISITDGHILFDQKSFNKGIRPAVNVFLSVTRVGKQTQSFLCRDTTRNLLSFLSKYEKAMEFSHFGSELSAESLQTLKLGDKMYKLFEQSVEEVVPINVQLFLIATIWKNIVPDLKPVQITAVKQTIIKSYASKSEVKTFIDKITTAKDFSELLVNCEKEKQEVIKLCAI